MKCKNSLLSVILVVLLVLPAVAVAEEEKEEDNGKSAKFASMKLDGYYRLRYTQVSDMPLFPDDKVPRAEWWDQRWRVAPGLTFRPGMKFFKKLSFHALADIYDGSFAIDEVRSHDYHFEKRTWDRMFLGKTSDWKEDGFWMREYWAEINLGVAVIRVGRMSSDWGKGILANEGRGFDDDFGDNYFGDIVERVLVGTKPIDLITGGKTRTDLMLAFAYDWEVVFDPTGDEDDDPEQYIVALLKEPEKTTGNFLHDLETGIYYVHRTQNEETTADVIDFFFNAPITFREGDLRVVPSMEAVYITGETEANKSLNAPEGSDVEQYGLAASLSAETATVDLVLEGGYASGDPDPFDDEITDFRFNYDYNVGLLMFERVLSAASAYSSQQFYDPALSRVPPEGIDLLPTNGAVTNAVYGYPRLRLRPLRKNLELVVGGLYAYAPQEVVDPYQSFMNGGVATNYNGGKPSHDMGWELDLGISFKYQRNDPAKIAARIGGQWGRFWPGDAFRDAQGDTPNPIDLAQFRFDILY